MSIEKTIHLIFENKLLYNKMQLYQKSVSVQPSNQKIIGNDSKHTRSLLDKSGHLSVIDFISSSTHMYNLSLRKLPHPILSLNKDLKIETIEFTIEGGYVNLVRFINHLEKTSGLGNISSVRYFINKDITTRKDYLCCTIYLQLIYSS
ncbi:MAG: hypothetical protein WC150_03215 [Bacteroidia bacterium]